MAKRKLAVVASASPIERPELNGEVYNIQALADGARAVIQRFYESHDDDPETSVLLTAMRILDVADERLDSLGGRVEGLEDREEVAPHG